MVAIGREELGKRLLFFTKFQALFHLNVSSYESFEVFRIKAQPHIYASWSVSLFLVV
jgi:hypothetical protein